MSKLLVFAVVLAGTEARLLGDNTRRIAPILSPKSDGKFFGKDYPHDERTSVGSQQHGFDHPYPAVQDHQDYEVDYVKDENADNGAWKSQMAYDELRRILHKEKADLDAAKADLEKAKKDLHDVKNAHEKATGQKEAASADVQKKQEEAKKADDALDKSTDKVRTEGGSVSEAKKEVASDETNLEECKKELEKVRSELKDVQAESEKAEAQKAAAEAERKNAEAKVAEAEQPLAQLAAQTEAEKAELEAAKKELAEEEAEEVKLRTEIQDTDAYKKVAAYREAADADGGVYPENPKKEAPAKSGAATALPTIAAALLLVAGSL